MNLFRRKLNERIKKIVYEQEDPATRLEKSWRELCIDCPPHKIGHTLPKTWLEAAEKVWEAEKKQKDPDSPLRILFVSGSSRDEDTCPQEPSKTEQLLGKAAAKLNEERPEIEIDWIDLGDMTAAKKPIIYPCKGCFSTASAHCIWPCNCYPNADLGQEPDWMNEIYEQFVAAHGIVMGTPVKWYKPDSVMCLLMDRLVCADGGNPDPYTINWKDREKSRALELSGDYKFVKHLAGRAIGFVVHGDIAGESMVLSSLKLTFEWMGLEVAGPFANGEFRIVPEDGSYANNQEALDPDKNPKIECIDKEIDTVVESVVKKAEMLRTDYTPPIIPMECMH